MTDLTFYIFCGFQEKVNAMLKNIVTENYIKSLEKYHW